MDSSEREIYAEERAYRILGDDRALTAYGRFFDAQLRYCRVRSMLGWLRAFARVAMIITEALLSAGIMLGPMPISAPAERRLESGQ